MSVSQKYGPLLLLIVSAILSLQNNKVLSDAILLEENFTQDPVAQGKAIMLSTNQSQSNTRFDHSATDGLLTAHYNSLQPSTLMRWSLGQNRSLNQSTSFRYNAKFKIGSADFFADPDAFAQISFGLVNSSSTGLDRTGSFANSASDNTFDLVTFDYFPNKSLFFPSPSVQAVVIESPISAGSDAFAGFHGPSSPESALNAPGESDLPRDAWLTAWVSYDAATRRVTLSILDSNAQPLTLNTVGHHSYHGGLDHLDSTIQFDLPQSAKFSLDSFALTLWNDGYSSASQPSVRANVLFDSFQVILPTPVPEPTAWVVMGSMMMLLGSYRGGRGESIESHAILAPEI